ncbi:choline kinase alpha-like [Brevipalpus obovatus]|uniref:choline kinase alpha-like n=1 Tax=Brevipalpus obovatus TaxID=246614 RepID=UPI003D9DFAB7
MSHFENSENVDESDRQKVSEVLINFFGSNPTSIQRLPAGRSNRVYLCSIQSRNNNEQYLIVRLYGSSFIEASQSASHNREKEVLICFIASEKRIGPKLVGLFDGGRIEEFVPSSHPTCDQYEGPSVFKVLAEKIAAIHSINMPVPKKWDSNSMLNGMFEAFSSNGKLDDFRSHRISNPFSESLMSFDFREEIDFIAPLFSLYPSKLVFCHNDLNRTNILLRNDSTGLDLSRKMVLIDFEYAAYGYRWSDFVVVFAEVCFCHWKESGEFMVSKYPDQKKRLFMAKSYIQTLNALSRSHDQDSLREEEQIKRLEAEMAFGILPACMINILWRLSHQQIDQNDQKKLWEEAYYWLKLYKKMKIDFMRDHGQ